MQSLWSHKPLRNSLMVTYGMVLVLAANLMPELTEWFQLVPFSNEVWKLIKIVSPTHGKKRWAYSFYNCEAVS